jgi:hypothetical protein
MDETTTVPKFDTLAIRLDSCTVAALYAENVSEKAAEAVVQMAVGRQGCDTHIFAAVPHGQYAVGQKWEGVK